MPTVSLPKEFRSRCCSCSSTNGSAVHWPTAASTTSPIPHTDRTANWKPHTTRPTRLFKIS